MNIISKLWEINYSIYLFSTFPNGNDRIWEIETYRRMEKMP